MTFTLIPSLVLALFLQTPKPAPVPAPKASISGTVVHSVTGSPVANVKVTLAKTDVSDSVTRYLSDMTGRGEGLPFPAMETTLPAEFFERMQAEMAAVPNGRPLPPEAAILKALPLDNLHSVMMGADGKVGFVPKSAPPVVTDGGGSFTFQGLEPGTYRLIFASNGFVRQDYGQLTVGSGGTPIVVTAGKSISNVVMRLIPTGSISGRVTDSTGQPMAFVPVQIARIGYDASGKKHTKAVASAQTDDRGEYRLYFVSPGRYYLSAGGNSSGMDPFGFAGGFNPYLLGSDVGPFLGPAGDFVGDFGFGVPPTTNRIVQNFGQSFYPRGADVTTATPVDVAPGSELSGVDVTVNIQGVFTVRGTVLDGSERPVPMASVNLLPAEGYPLGAEALLGAGIGFDGSGNATSSNGTFELRKVRPGSYTAMAQSNDFNPEGLFREEDQRAIVALPPAEQEKFYMEMEAKMMAAAAEQPRAMATITVGNGDLEGVTLRLVKGVKVAGRVRVQPDASGRPPAIERLRVQLVGAVAMPFGLYGPYGIDSQQPVKPDGAFEILGLLPGEYQVAVSGIPAGYYVKSARYGEVDALNNALTLPTEKPGTLEVVLSPGLGQVEGTVTSDNGRSAAGAQLVLIPDRNRARTELFRPVIVDSSSRFSLQNVTPGDYHLVAWEAIDPFEFFDPTLIAQAEEKGRPVRVGESSKQTVDVRVLPRP